MCNRNAVVVVVVEEELAVRPLARILHAAVEKYGHLNGGAGLGIAVGTF